MKKGQGLLMFALVMSAFLIGSVIGDAAANSDSVQWLGRGFDIGLSDFELDLHFFVLKFSLMFKVCIAQVIMLLFALLGFSKLSKMIFG